MALALLLSLRTVGEGNAGVLGSPILRLEPRLVGGWALAPPPFLRLYRYPLTGKTLRLHFPRDGAAPLTTRDGSAVGVEGTLSAHALAERVLDLHRQHGEEFFATLVVPKAREALAARIAADGYDGVRARGILALEGRVATDLAAALALEGVALESLRLERLELGAAGAGAQALGRPARRARVVLVGLDGADWNLIDPLLARGRLPNLKRILERGSSARLRTLTPVLSPVLWTSIATGKRPEKHGIVDFLATSRETGEKIPVTSNLRRARPLWHILGDHGLRSNVVAWWATWPAEPLRGFLVSDRVAYQLFGLEENRDEAAGKTYPPELYARIRALVRSPDEVGDAEVERFIPELRRAGLAKRYPDLIRDFRALLASARSYTDIALMLLREEPADFSAVYLEGIDTSSHLFMRYRPPRPADVSEAEARWFGRVVDRYYEHEDEVLGRLMAAAGPEATIVVCSDHGFRSDRNRPPGDARIGGGRAAEWHRKYGILALAGPEVARAPRLEDASLLDLAPTLLALYDLPAGEDMDGRLLEATLRPEFLKEHPPRSIATYEPAVLERVAEDPIASAADVAIRQKLAALGYLSLEGSNAYNNRGTLLLGEGRTDEAIAEFSEALRIDPGFMPVRVNLGRAYLQKRDYAQALDIFEGVLRQRPDFPDALNLVGNIFMETGDLAAAEERFRRAVEIDPNFADAHNSLGILYERTGRPAEAERSYRQVARIDPEYAEAYNNVANVLRARGAWQEAVREYERAIAADPSFAGSYNNLGLAYQERGMLREAQEVLERGLAKSPRHPILHSSLGSVHYAAGRYERALEEFQRAVDLDARYAEAYNNLGAAYGRLRRPDEQEAAYRKAIDIDPRYADARHNLALALAARGERAAAREELQRAVEADPGHAGSWALLGSLYEQEGDLGEAIRCLENAKAADPMRLQIYNHLGDLYARVGQPERAAREFRRSLQIDPDQPRLRERLRAAGEPAGR